MKAIFLLFFICLCPLVVAYDIPSPKGMINDLTGTLTSEQIKYLEDEVSKFEQNSSNEIAVLMIDTLNGESLEDVSMQIATKWGIGQVDKDNGILIFIVKTDRKIRIEVGYGLEGAIPDGLTGEIIRNDITPLFKQEKYYEGIIRGIEAIELASQGEYTQPQSEDIKIGTWTLIFILMGVVGLVFLFIYFLDGIGGSGGYGGSFGGYSNSGSSSSGSFGGGSFGGGGASGSW